MRKEPQKQAAKNVSDVYLQVSLVVALRPQSLLLGPQVHQTGGEGAQQGPELMLMGLQAVR